MNAFFLLIIGTFKLYIRCDSFLGIAPFHLKCQIIVCKVIALACCLSFFLTLTHLFNLFLLPLTGLVHLSELDSSLGFFAHYAFSLSHIAIFILPNTPKFKKCFISYSRATQNLLYFPFTFELSVAVLWYGLDITLCRGYL